MSEYGVSQEDWDRVLTRDKEKCQRCPADADTVDHVIPRSRGGNNDPRNLAARCRDDNCGSGATPPTAEEIAEISRRQKTFETDSMRAIEHVWAIIQTWPARPNEKTAKQQLDQYTRWLHPGELIRHAKHINDQPNHHSNPPWQQLVGTLVKRKNAVLDKRGRTITGIRLERWNEADTREFLLAENQQLKRRMAEMEKRQRNIERYLLGEDEEHNAT